MESKATNRSTPCAKIDMMQVGEFIDAALKACNGVATIARIRNQVTKFTHHSSLSLWAILDLEERDHLLVCEC